MTTMTSAGTAGDAIAEAADLTLLDEATFEGLYATAARPLWSYLYRVLGDAAQAEDLMQDAFLRLLRAPVGQLDADALRAYLFRIAGNLAVDAFRAGKRHGQAHDAIGHEQPQSTPAVEKDLDTARSFAALDPRERAMLWMAYVEGSPHEEIARSLKVKPGSVKVLLFRARKRLAGLVTRRGSRGGQR